MLLKKAVGYYFTYEQAITVTLPKAAPVVLDTIVYWTPTPYSKTITVKRPADRTGYDPAWVEIFKTNMCGPEVTIDLRFEDL
ncbi:MAG: hypothetical protein LBU28_09200 [Spirochaetaceae bacterium]|jgi:hypothetical protein|nr:hypothetical protein [Spirochaetaceae bacterium]